MRDTAAANLARGRTYRFAFILPENANEFVAMLDAQIEDLGADLKRDRTQLSSVKVPAFDPMALAQAIARIDPEEVDGVAIFGLETPSVRDAISALKAQGVSVVSLVSDIPSSERDNYVGVDNIAAGRTAAQLLGRFLGQRQGKVLVLTGSMLARDHLERRLGFDEVMARDFPHLEVISTYSGHDDIEGNYTEVSEILESRPDLVGIYNVGGGNEGIAQALKEAGRQDAVTFFGHNLTPKTQSYLLEGTMDLILHQNMKRAAGRAVDALIARLENRPYQIKLIPTEIISREYNMGVTFG